jgi:ribosome-associated protein
MDAMLQTEAEIFALELGKLLDDHRGLEVIVMDMRPLDFWTDFFIIATVTSYTHLSGLERHIKNYAKEKGFEIFKGTSFQGSRKPKTNTKLRSSERNSALLCSTDLGSDEWSLLDLGDIVIHLMTAKTRQFFELERLWSAAPLIFKTGASQNSG